MYLKIYEILFLSKSYQSFVIFSWTFLKFMSMMKVNRFSLLCKIVLKFEDYIIRNVVMNG